MGAPKEQACCRADLNKFAALCSKRGIFFIKRGVAPVKVERTLVALGLLLAVAGVIVALNGYIYVNVDRGPPLMVSGVLAFGFGLVLAALGFILRELQAISADASKAALLLAKSRNGSRNGAVAAEPLASSPKTLPPLAPFEPPPAAPPAAPVALEPEPAKQPDLAKPSEADTFAAPSAEKLRRPGLPPALAPRLELAKPPGSSPPFSWMLRPNSADKPVAKAEEDDWLNRAITAEADKAKGHETQEDKQENVPEDPARSREAEQALKREFGLRDPEAQGPPEANPPPKPEVIGNYEAHGAHYTMYADGSIEAETQHGVYRFASMEELKRFIEGEEAAEGA